MVIGELYLTLYTREREELTPSSYPNSFIPNRDGLDIATSFSLLNGTGSSASSSVGSSPNKGKRKANAEFDAQAGKPR